MSRKAQIILILLILFVFSVGGFLYYYFVMRGNTALPNAFPNSFGGEGDFIEALPLPGSRDEEDDTSNEEVPGQPVPIYRRITQKPTAGIGAGVTSEGESRLYYIESATGHVYEVDPNIFGDNRISNTTIPRITEALWSQSGSRVIYRYLNQTDAFGIETFSGTITPGTAGSGRVEGVFLEKNITNLSLSPSSDASLLVVNTPEGSDIVMTENDGTNRKVVYSLPFREILLNWFSDNTALITTKASGSAFGYSYLLSLSSKTLKKAMREYEGLVVNPNTTGEYYLYSKGGQSKSPLFVYTSKNSSSLELPLVTIAEKCTWSKDITWIAYCAVPSSLPNGLYPDVWYQGKISFTDSLWRIDAKEGSAVLIFSPERSGESSVDATNLTLSTDEKFLIFKDRNTTLVWGLRL